MSVTCEEDITQRIEQLHTTLESLESEVEVVRTNGGINSKGFNNYWPQFVLLKDEYDKISRVIVREKIYPNTEHNIHSRLFGLKLTLIENMPGYGYLS